MSDANIYIEIGESLLKSIASLSGLSEKRVLYRLNDEALDLCDRLKSPDIELHWLTKTFQVPGFPIKLKVRAKYDSHLGFKAGNIFCRFNIVIGKCSAYDAEQLAAEAAEAILLRGE